MLNKKKRRWQNHVAIVVSFFAMQVSPARDLLVPDEFSMISQAVVAVTSPDDRVVVTDRGVYAESVQIDRDLVLISDPPGAQVQPATGDDCVLVSGGASRVTIRGFMIGASEKTGIVVEMNQAARRLVVD